MTPGTGTTTQSINSDVVGPGYLLNTLTVLYQLTATSSTSAQPQANLRIDDSQDGIDWYGRAQTLASNSTSTPLTGSFANYSINIATSTADLGPAATTTRMNGSFNIPVYAKYTRLVWTVPTGGGKLGLWYQIVGIAQKQ